VLAGQQKFHGGSVYTATDTTFGNAFFVPPYRAGDGRCHGMESSGSPGKLRFSDVVTQTLSMLPAKVMPVKSICSSGSFDFHPKEPSYRPASFRWRYFGRPSQEYCHATETVW
jgi:hypothetical protein